MEETRFAVPRRCVPDALDQKAIATELRTAFRGGASADVEAIVWEDGGDEAVVHLSSLRAVVGEGMLVVSIDLEADPVGRGPVIVRFAFGAEGDAAPLIASTDKTAHGDATLAGRWGSVVRDVVWAALLGAARDHASERGGQPKSIRLSAGALHLAAAPISLVADLVPPRPPAPPACGKEDERA